MITTAPAQATDTSLIVVLRERAGRFFGRPGGADPGATFRGGDRSGGGLSLGRLTILSPGRLAALRRGRPAGRDPEGSAGRGTKLARKVRPGGCEAGLSAPGRPWPPGKRRPGDGRDWSAGIGGIGAPTGRARKASGLARSLRGPPPLSGSPAPTGRSRSVRSAWPT